MSATAATLTGHVVVLEQPALMCVACGQVAIYDAELTRSRLYARLCESCLGNYMGRQPSRVYFLRGGNMVKIGHSVDVEARRKLHQTGSPVELELWHVEIGGRDEEAALHKRFASDRAHGEWFRVSDEIRDYVEGK